jgi:hypothetical protein
MKMRAPVLAVAFGVFVSVPLFGQAQRTATPSAPAANKPLPRTPWGHPDLQGTWDYRTITPLERPRDAGEFLSDAQVTELETRATRRMTEAPEENPRSITVHPPYWTDPGTRVLESKRTSLIVDPPDGRVPALTPDAQKRGGGGRRGGGGGGEGEGARAGGRVDSWEDRSLLERCITWGLPTAILPGLYNNNILIVQSPDYVAITHEMVHDTRLIPLDGRPHRSGKLRGYLGDSRGRWEGDTLVVETTNFSEKANYRGANTNLKLIERFRRVDARTLAFELTVEDPTTWTKSWTAAFPMRLSDGEIYEYACHEGNYGLLNMLEVARDEEKGVKR